MMDLYNKDIAAVDCCETFTWKQFFAQTPSEINQNRKLLIEIHITLLF